MAQAPTKPLKQGKKLFSLHFFIQKIAGLSNSVSAGFYAVILTVAIFPKAWKLDFPDFKVFYSAARHALRDPENIYKLSPDRYLYPPSTSILLAPFALTEYWHWHAALWHCLLGILIFLLARRSPQALLACLLLTRYLLVSLGYGQINLLVLALMLCSQLLLDTGRQKSAGVIWALVASLKVYPLVLGAEFALRKRWLGIVTFTLTIVGLLALPFLFFGASLGKDLYQQFLAGLAGKGLPLHSHNQSFVALFSRICTKEAFELHGVGWTQWGFFPIGALPARIAASFVGFALAIFSWWRARKLDTGYLSAAAFSILFLSHIVWKDYLLFLYFPLVEILGNRGISFRKKTWGACLFLAMVTFSSADFAGPRRAALFDAASIHLWGAVLVWVAWINCLSVHSSSPVTKRPSLVARSKARLLRKKLS